MKGQGEEMLSRSKKSRVCASKEDLYCVCVKGGNTLQGFGRGVVKFS